MKTTEVQFDRVRDCPWWSHGVCGHSKGNEMCHELEIATVPGWCPCEDAQC